MLPLADHPGDWLVSLAYAAPALIVVGLILLTALRRKSAPDPENQDDPPRHPPESGATGTRSSER